MNLGTQTAPLTLSKFNHNLGTGAGRMPTVWRLLPVSSDSTITGFDYSSFSNVELVLLRNDAVTGNVIITHADIRSLAVNRVTCPGAVSLVIPPSGVCVLVADGTGLSLWPMSGLTGSTGPQGDAGSQGPVGATGAPGPLQGLELNYIGANGTWFSGIDTANSPERDFVAVGVRNTYSFTDGVTTSGSPTVTSATLGGFSSALVGAAVSGPGVPNGTTVSSVASVNSLTLSANATITATGVRVTITRNSVIDLLYALHRGSLSPTFGVGVTPPNGSARIQVSAQDDEPAMATMRLRRGPSQTGDVLAVHDSTPTTQWVIDKDFFMLGGAIGIKIKAEASATGHVLTLCDPSGGNQYSFDQPTGSGSVLRFRQTTNNATIADFGTDGSIRHLSSKFGFFSATPVTKPTVTGSKTAGAALVSLLAALVSLGLITDSTTT
jgi:hypothetical protein